MWWLIGGKTVLELEPDLYLIYRDELTALPVTHEFQQLLSRR